MLRRGIGRIHQRLFGRHTHAAADHDHDFNRLKGYDKSCSDSCYHAGRFYTDGCSNAGERELADGNGRYEDA